MKEAICPDHRATSTDHVALNTKKEPVFRCVGGIAPPHFPHYFTVEGAAKERLAKEAKR